MAPGVLAWVSCLSQQWGDMPGHVPVVASMTFLLQLLTGGDARAMCWRSSGAGSVSGAGRTVLTAQLIKPKVIIQFTFQKSPCACTMCQASDDLHATSS